MSFVILYGKHMLTFGKLALLVLSGQSNWKATENSLNVRNCWTKDKKLFSLTISIGNLGCIWVEDKWIWLISYIVWGSDERGAIFLCMLFPFSFFFCLVSLYTTLLMCFHYLLIPSLTE